MPQRGWATIKNGLLLRLAEAGFDAFIAVDRNLSFQQSLPKFEIAVVVLRAKSNRLEDLKPPVPRWRAALPEVAPDSAEPIRNITSRSVPPAE